MKINNLFVLIIYIFINLLIGNRILKSVKKYWRRESKGSLILYWAVFIFFSCSFSIYMNNRNSLPTIIGKPLYFIGSNFEIALLYLIMLFPISFILSKLFKKLSTKIDFYIIALIIALILLPISYYLGTHSKTTTYNVKINKPLYRDFKIGLVSDIHLGAIIGNSRLDTLISELNSLNLDLIIISGDLIDSNLDTVIQQDMLSKFSNLKSNYGTFFALGNHDLYTHKVKELTNLLESYGISVLKDKSILIDNYIYLVGRNDIVAEKYNETRAPLNNLISGLDASKTLIVIDHNPNEINEAINSNIDLQLSGHTHNGQIFPLNLFAKKIFSLAYGKKTIDNTTLIVTSGYGSWGPTMRMGSQSEIVIINLEGN